MTDSAASQRLAEAVPGSFPDRLEIPPIQQPINATLSLPGSKSITNRALVLAALATGERGCTLQGALQSNDTEVMVSALQALGFRLQTAWADDVPRIVVPPGTRKMGDSPIATNQADLYVADSGTCMRFLTALVSLGHGHFRLDGSARMRERPMADLLGALTQLGVDVRSERGDGKPPIVVNASRAMGGAARIRCDVSSQFLSGLLMAAPLATHDTVIDVDGPRVSMPYVEMTTHMVRRFGGVIEDGSGQRYRIPCRQAYEGVRQFDIEPDATAASYFFAAAAITGGRVRVRWAQGAYSPLQGDWDFMGVLVRMGCECRYEKPFFSVRGADLRGIEADMNAMSDCVMTLAAVACFAEGPTTIRNVAHIRQKESDRLRALSAELRRVGADVDEFADGLKITPRPLHAALVQSYDDHRMAMSLALLGLRVPGIVIDRPECVCKTYPGFFRDLARLYDE